jgi:hypothetical protein
MDWYFGTKLNVISRASIFLKLQLIEREPVDAVGPNDPTASEANYKHRMDHRNFPPFPAIIEITLISQTEKF